MKGYIAQMSPLPTENGVLKTMAEQLSPLIEETFS